MPPFGGQFVHQFPDGVHPVQSAHVGPAEEQPLFHIALHRFDEGVGGAITRPAEITARFTGAINAMNK